jgi:hypothetical protein
MFPEWRTSVGPKGLGEAETSSPRQTVEASPGGAGLVLHLGLEVIVAEQVIDGTGQSGLDPAHPDQIGDSMYPNGCDALRLSLGDVAG